jgi:hypothetical protein
MMTVLFKNRLMAAGVTGCIWLLCPMSIEARPKIDKVTLDNGDRVTCEIKELSRGILSIKTNYTKGAISVEWEHVHEISSSQLFEVELEDGSKYYGAFAAASEAAKMIVMSGIETNALDLYDVIRISPLDKNFWERIDGSLDLGATAKKANHERSYNLAASAKYRARKYRVTSSLNSFLSDRSDTRPTRRSDFNVSYSRKLRERWFWATATRFERNEELDLDLRTTISGTGGRFIVQTNRTLLSWAAGLAGNREWYIGADQPNNNLEAVLSLDYQRFVFGTRETDITIAFNVLPNISTWGRVRSNLDAKIRHELFTDFYFSVGLLADYDSDPPTGSEEISPEQTDWNFTTSVGYSF